MRRPLIMFTVLILTCIIVYVAICISFDPFEFTAQIYHMHDSALQMQSSMNVSNTVGKTHRSSEWKVVNERTSPNVKNSAIAIDKLRDKWQNTFFNIFIKYEFASLFPHSNGNNTRHVEDNIKIFNHLLNETNILFISSNHTTNKQIVLWSHRQIISIRRYIMILYKYLSSTNSTRVNMEQYHSLIHDIFIKIRIKYKQLIKNNKYWFLIHISKSAGSTVCATQKVVGYKQLKHKGTNCNIPYHGAPIKNEDKGTFSCNDIENIRRNEDTEFMASERPMTGHKMSNKPSLCNKYHYILPIRYPLRRVASTLNEYHLAFYFPFEILTKYRKEPNIAKNTNIDCSQRLVVSNGSTYGPLMKKEDFSDIVSHLFDNEKELDDITESLWQNNMKCKARSTLDNAKKTLYKYDDMTYITYLGKDRKYAIKITEGFKHRSNVSLLRGYCSNTYTRWIGYERNGMDDSYDALFERSYNMNITHWINGVDFMMMTDYVLPFDSVFEHDIFKFTLNDLWHFNGERRRLNVLSRLEGYRNRKKYKNRRYIDRISRYKGKERVSKPASRTEWAHQHAAYDDRYHISTAHVMSSWSVKEKQFIESKNLFDIQLFKMAIWIADVDSIFYDQVNE